MAIPIENIYYLLCYAWNKLEERDQAKVSTDGITELKDLFAKVLINATKLLLKRGIDRHYIDTSQELAGIKGKIEFSQTLKSGLNYKQRTICAFDEFSANILSNQILLTTIYRMLNIKGLDSDLKSDLRKLQWMLAGIDYIDLKTDLFKKVKLNRNNHFYGFIMNICQIIYEFSLPTEEKGEYKFSDFTRDKNKMNQLFEAFIRNFYRFEQQEYKVRREVINWQFEGADDFLPQMNTDITLEKSLKKIIIDAKFYQETMSENYGKQKIISQNLYQLFSYLLNQESADPKTINSTGILIYPTIDREHDLTYKYKDHTILIKTINLDTNWRNIETRLKEIINI